MKDLQKFICWNEKCSEYKKPNNDGHIIFSHMDGMKKDIMFLRCKVCGKKFSENKGTMFYWKKKDRDMISKVLTATSEGMGIRAAARTFGIDKDTVLAWVKQGGKHSQKVENFF